MFHYQKGELTTGLGKDATEKKVVEVKNLKGKMDNLKEEDFKRILANLTAQNNKLKEQYTHLNTKVSQLLQKRKYEKRQANHHLQSQIQQAKKQLQQQYKIVDHYKREVQRQNQSKLEDKLLDKYNSYINTQTQINNQKQQLLKQKKILQRDIEQNSHTVKEYTDDRPFDAAEFERVTGENREMRRKLNMSKKTLTLKERESQEAIDRLLSLKMEHRKRMSLAQGPATSEMVIPEYKRDGLDLTHLQREVEELKYRKSQLEGKVEKEKSQHDQKRIKMEKKIRDSLEIQKTLTRQKTKVINTLNMYESVERQSKQAAVKAEIPVQDPTKQYAVQTEQQIVYNFRRDWAGKLGKVQCDDGRVLEKERERGCVKRAVVYMNGEVIVACRFTYSISGETRMTELPMEEEYLRRLTPKTFQIKEENEYLHRILIGIRQNQIVKLQFSSNLDQKFSFGSTPQGTVSYLLDILQTQRPICMFQSFQSVSKDKYVLQALGCQILEA